MRRFGSTLCFFLCCLSLCASAQDSTEYALFPGADVYIVPGAHVNLLVLKRAGPLSAWMENGVNLSDVWTVNGKTPAGLEPRFGKFTERPMSTSQAVYEAPPVSPGTEPVLVAVELGESDRDHANRAKTKNILFCRIHIGNAPNFFSVGSSNANGGVFKLHEPASRQNTMAEVAIFGQGQWNISITGMQDSREGMKPMSIGISIGGNAKGSYPFQVKTDESKRAIPPSTIVSVSGVNADGSPFQFISTDCTPHGNPSNCDPHSLKGTVTITEIDEKAKWIKGYFYGQVISADQSYSFISGSFRAYIH